MPTATGKLHFVIGAVPDFVAAFALAHERTTGRSQQIPQSAVELRRNQEFLNS
jgi:hypothetical protein